MDLKRLLSVCVSLLMINVYAEVWLSENFNKLSPDSLPAGGVSENCKFKGFEPPHISVVPEAPGSKNNVLKIARVSTHRAIVFEGKKPFPVNRKYVVGFNASHRGGFYLMLNDKNNQVIAGVSFSQNKKISFYDQQKNWVDSGITIPNGWFAVDILVDPSKGTYIIYMKNMKGSVYTSPSAPLLNNEVPANITFGNSMPVKGFSILDNLRIAYDDHSFVSNRKNVIPSSEISRKGNVTHIDLKAICEVSTIRLIGKTTPSLIRGRNAMGQWVTLPVGSVARDVRQIDFPTERLNLIEITSPEKFDGIEVYEAKYTSLNDVNTMFRKKVYGEFFLPVYTKEKFADLHLFNTTADMLDVTVDLIGRYDEKKVAPVRKIALTPGENIINFPLENLTNGEYAAIITAADGKGMFQRLLRFQKYVPQTATGVTDFTGQKMFFPDKYYLRNANGITFETGKGELIQVTDKQVAPELLLKIGMGAYVADGKMHVPFWAVDNFFRSSSMTYFMASSPVDDLKKWNIEKISKNSFPRSGSVLAEGSGNPDNMIKKLNGKVTYRLYDPAKDGKIDLKQVEIKYITFMAEGTIENHDIPHCPGVVIGKRTTWVLWHKEPGLTLLVNDKPLLHDGLSAGDFESQYDTNDNFAGQYLSEDNKTLFYVRGRILRRYPPYNVSYDNGAPISRILTIFKTTDGINFEQRFFAVPDHNDISGTQHYGAHLFKMRRGNGLRAGLVSWYYAREQRMATAAVYSHDGFNWNRPEKSSLFIDNGEHGSYYAGSVVPCSYSTSYNGNVYFVMKCSPIYHICSELIWDRADMNTLTGPFVKQYMSNRGIENWPVLKKFKDWNDLAAYIRNDYYSVALMKFREDGLFFMNCPGQGSFTTTPLKTRGKWIFANVEFSAEGSMTVNAVDKNGKIIATKTINQSGISVPLFNNLPEEEFTLNVTLNRAKLYALKF